MRPIDSFLRMVFLRQVEEKDGLIRMGGLLAVLSTPVNVFVNLREELKERAGPAMARDVLFEVGRLRSLAGAESLSKKPVIGYGGARPFLGKPLAQLVIDLWRMTGWGNYKLSRYDESRAVLYGTTPTARAYLERFGPSKEPVCDLICGMLAGGMEMVYHKPYDCIETTCAAMGKPTCTFELFKSRRPAGTSPALRGKSRSSSRRSRRS